MVSIAGGGETQGAGWAVRFITLGRFELWTGDDVQLDLGRGRPRQLLAMLLLRANATLTYGALIDGLWEKAPCSAFANLRTYASAARRLLATADLDADRRLNTAPGGYRLDVSSDELDILRWSNLLTTGVAAHQAGELSVAISNLGEACDLWRGPPFGGLHLHGTSSAWLTSLEERNIGARETLIEARLDVGAHHELIGDLRSLVGEYPLRERLWVSLMLALYRSGRQTEALRAYHEVRDKLVREVGVEPGPELQAMERAILTSSPTSAP